MSTTNPAPAPPLNESEIFNLRIDARYLQDNSEPMLRRFAKKFGGEVLRLLDEFAVAQARIAALEEAARWRLPDEAGEWKELPPKEDEDDHISIEVDITLESPDGKRHIPEEGGYDFAEQRWHDADAQNWLAWKVVAWRPKAAPYTAPFVPGEPT